MIRSSRDFRGEVELAAGVVVKGSEPAAPSPGNAPNEAGFSSA
jgi:hypothetical protein